MKKKTTKPDETLEKIINNPELRREWIKFQLRIHGSSLAALAGELGVKRQTVQCVFSCHYPKMELAIAKKIGMEPKHIWPERYQNAA